jgi:hypothetical protein
MVIFVEDNSALDENPSQYDFLKIRKNLDNYNSFDQAPSEDSFYEMQFL